jgi:hypothetical protein
VTTRFPPRAAAPALLALAALAAGCPSYDGSCESSALCDAGTFCFDGRCVAALPAGSVTLPGTRTIVEGGTVASSYPAGCPTTNVAPIASSWAQDLGTFAVGETISFDVPAGAASFTVHIQGVSPAPASVVDFGGGQQAPNYVVPARVQTPDGDTLFAFKDPFTTPLDPSLESGYFAPNAWSASFTVPSTHRLTDLALARGAVPAGRWSLTLSDLQSGCDLFGGCVSQPGVTYRASVIVKPGPYVSTGRLPLNFYFASATVSASVANGARQAAYQRFVKGIDELLGQAGIAIDTVTFYDLPATAVTDFAATNIDGLAPCDEMSRLFSMAQPGADGVHVFLVDDLTSGSSGVVGYTGSIPGPTGIPGDVAGGIITSLTDVDLGGCGTAFDLHCNADFSAYVTAHEIGHWLGLYHPTEAMGDMFDPLADTASCECAACSPAGCPPPYPPGMAASACMAESGRCGGGLNLMFWTVDPGRSRGDVTREQAFVMRANPAVKWERP